MIKHFDTKKYDLLLLGITQQGSWYHFRGEIEKIRDDSWCTPDDCIPAIISPSRDTKGLIEIAEQGCTVIELEAAMPVLHGKNSEDGTIQSLLELGDIPIIGCGATASALCMDKDLAHRIVQAAGVRTPRSYRFDSPDSPLIQPAAQEIGYPLFVKPVKAGSSFGITRVEEASSLNEAVRCAFAHDDQIIIEEGIEGFEVGCAILGNDDLTIGEVDEIELSKGFFNFEEKYSLKTSAIHVPARISAEKAEQIKQTAATIYRTLGCSGFARVDMFLTPQGDIVFNEVNTIPGFTTHSRYPSMMKAVGIDFGTLIDAAVKLTLSA